ncbi:MULTISPECIES: iron-containing alcohol dehydrogenase [unclassified Amycolatopsis]|uniref:iron-containing alcohol dehydrogenase n=1 Tax=unclassified Amycolatopsis TaxID=2618356 RepID=UPI001C6A6BF3|nr:iron-containing alcohol dehydrogenase [Amycolatopsis sp. DSM 110486]QYN20417.1 iron-containing alcohol dehydrogenase [Amycolatopsis sp. DSM 110486]
MLTETGAPLTAGLRSVQAAIAPGVALAARRQPAVERPAPGARKAGVPVPVADEARELARSAGADSLLSVGSCSTTATAKAVALSTGPPIIAIPTKYVGSEVTPVWGLTDAARKTTGTDPRMLPRTVIYDPELTCTLPVDLSAASGLNVMAHCVEAFAAPRRNPISSPAAEEGIRALAAVLADPDDLEARGNLLHGARTAGARVSQRGHQEGRAVTASELLEIWVSPISAITEPGLPHPGSGRDEHRRGRPVNELLNPEQLRAAFDQPQATRGSPRVPRATDASDAGAYRDPRTDCGPAKRLRGLAITTRLVPADPDARAVPRVCANVGRSNAGTAAS